MINPADYSVTINIASEETASQTKYDIFALLHKVAYDNLNEERVFSKYAYDKVTAADPAQATSYASFVPTVPTIASIIEDANALYAFALDINSNVTPTPRP
jgi:hypothetical protein